MVGVKQDVSKKTLLGYELTTYQDVILNYLIPSVSACLLYIFLIAFDTAVIYSHFKNNDPIWGSLTLFFMYLPVLGSFIIIVSNWELWPEFEECSRKNMNWLLVKTVEHLLFPIWSMWRFAERIFWSIEAVRAKNEDSVTEALSHIVAPRSIELYIFLQSYLHSLPQILLQLYILIRHNATIDRERENAQVLSLVFNLAKLSITTTYYQRFKSQKLTGKQYPWYKQYKASEHHEYEVVLRKPNLLQSRQVVDNRRSTKNLQGLYNLEPPQYSERRRSSDIYLEPATSGSINKQQLLLETDFDEEIKTKINLQGIDEVDTERKQVLTTKTETSPTDEQVVHRITDISESSEPDFNISRVIYIQGLADDDLAGKLIAFLWWYGFLLARVLAISIFAYFFMEPSIWLLSSHFILVVTLLAYDVKTDAVKRAKALFFVFIGMIYIFCIIEFKIKFKKAYFIYYGFFVLVFVENFIMCMIWYIRQIESLENDYWFRYAFYVIVGCSLISFSSMVFYLTCYKPPKVVVEARTVSVNSQRR